MKVIVAAYTHKHGMDLRVFSTFELAGAWKREIASDNWDDLMDEEKPLENMAALYFERAEEYGEFFETNEYEIDG